MITAAWLWAANTNNLRKSCIHGEEEAKLILTDSFEAADVTSHETSQTGAMDIEDENGTLFDTDVPDIDGNAASIASGNGSTAAASSAAKAVQLESFSSSASFKLRDQLQECLKAMTDLFAKLTCKQSESLTSTIDKSKT
ncbi:unnamed protein product [Symbiodinium microadriaticum]|nr:unnamed protein product [Symbiodinium microadriaticum]